MDKNVAFRQLRILQIIRSVIESSLSNTHTLYPCPLDSNIFLGHKTMRRKLKVKENWGFLKYEILLAEMNIIYTYSLLQS